mmetsp:Transcript_8044/g.12753  ORF Transcript_8044/g.12753 Transcript_8044/m.12753 type:complete len:419 (+) Transcript_8044:61-1317(+)
MMERNMPDPHDLELIQADFDKAEEYVLPASFVPGKWDVICQRGKECFEHVGNRRFRMAIDNHLDSYMKVKSRQQKSKIVTSIVEGIKKSAGCNGGGFIRKDLLTRRWFRVSDKLAREKVGQALRDAIKTHRALNKKASPGKAASFEKKAPAEVDQLSDPKKRHQQHGSSSNSINRSQISSAAGPLNPSDIMPLVPFMESKSFADIEPRPVSLPLNLNEFLSGTFLNQSVEVAPTTANEQQNLFLLNRTQQDAEAKRNILHNSPVVSSNTHSNVFQSNTLSQSYFPNQIPFSNFGNNSGAGDYSVAGAAAPGANMDYSFPMCDQQQMLPSVIESRPLSSSFGNELRQPDDAVGSNVLGTANNNSNPFDVGNSGTFMFQKYPTYTNASQSGDQHSLQQHQQQQHQQQQQNRQAKHPRFDL